MKTILTTLLVAVLGFAFGYTAYYFTIEAKGAISCHTIRTENDYVSKKYGSPLDLFARTPDTPPLMRALCDGETVYLNVGNGKPTEFIYKKGYQQVDGKWEPIIFKGEKTAGPWVIGNAQAVVTRTSTELAKQNKYLAYICQNIDGEWKCGCKDRVCAEKKWQMQEFTVSGGEEEDDGAYVQSATPNPVSAGGELLLQGKNFTQTNTVHFGDEYTFEGVPSQDGKTLTITVPDDVAPKGYRVQVELETGEWVIGPEVRVVDSATFDAPHITSISPASGPYGTVITIHGTGFTRSGNDVYVGFGAIRNVPSRDGKTLVIPITPMDNFYAENEDLRYTPETVKEVFDALGSYPLYITVVNEGGIFVPDMSNPIIFTITSEQTTS